MLIVHVIRVDRQSMYGTVAIMSRWVVCVLFGLICASIHDGALSAPDTYAQLRDDIQAWANGPTSSLSSFRVVMFSPPLTFERNLQGGSANLGGRELQTLADSLPLPRQTFAAAGRSVFDVYRAILQYRATEKFVLSREQADTLRSAECVLLKHHCWWNRTVSGVPELREPSERLLRYQALNTRIAVLRTTLMRVNDAGSKERLLKQIAGAERELDRCGNRRKVEAALSKFTAIQNQNPERLWGTLAGKLLANSRDDNGELKPQTIFSPDSSNWLDMDGWRDWKKWRVGRSTKNSHDYSQLV